MNLLRERWRANETAFGFWGTIDSGFVAELLGAENPDFFCCDQQHGILDHATMVSMFQGLRASGCIGLTRVASHDPMLLGKSLDAGADGVIVPMVESAEQARKLIAAFDYQPAGTRSFGPIRAGTVLGSTATSDLESVLRILMIETMGGLAAVEEIAAVKGVDVLYVGPADLSLSLGLPPTFDSPDPRYREALDRILGACRNAGVTAGIQCTSGDMALRYSEMGFRFITVASDANTLRSAMRRQLDIARGDKLTKIVGGYA